MYSHTTSYESSKSTPVNTTSIPLSKMVSPYVSTTAKDSDSVDNAVVNNTNKSEAGNETKNLHRDQENDDDDTTAPIKTDCSPADNQKFLNSTNIESDKSENSYKDLDDMDELSENPVNDNVDGYISLKSSNNGGSEDQLISSVSSEQQNLDVSRLSNDFGSLRTVDSSELPIATSFNSNNEVIVRRSSNSSQVEDFSVLDHNIELYMDLNRYVNGERSKCNLKVSKVIQDVQ